MIGTSLASLWYGFGVALEPHNLMFCFIGVREIGRAHV
jgi:putative tricarboxylic transport membrane protein